MNFHALRWGAFIGYVAGGGLSASFVFLALLDKPHSTIMLGAGAALISIAGAIKILLPAPSVIADAPVLTNKGAKDGTNVSTTSTEPIVAPAPARLDMPAQNPTQAH